MKVPELAVGGGPPAIAIAALVNTAVLAQEVSAGAYARKVTLPVGVGAGAAAPVTVAVSEMVPPRTAVAVAEVERVGTAWFTTVDSLAAPQSPVTVV
jgi:hypothetical protein